MRNNYQVKPEILKEILSMKQFDKSKLNEVEEVMALRKHTAKPEGEKEYRVINPGEVYKISGLLKAEAIMSGDCTLDLNIESSNDFRNSILKAVEFIEQEIRHCDYAIAAFEKQLNENRKKKSFLEKSLWKLMK